MTTDTEPQFKIDFQHQDAKTPSEDNCLDGVVVRGVASSTK